MSPRCGGFPPRRTESGISPLSRDPADDRGSGAAPVRIPERQPRGPRPPLSPERPHPSARSQPATVARPPWAALMMDRRTLLRLGGGGLLGAGLGACAARSDVLPREPAFRLPIVNVAWNRIIRTTVGLRPYRPSGFVLRAGKLDATAVIHNYGHGGSGISLSWGTGRRVAEMALEHQSRQAAVIGCGAVGLATARQLQRRGFDVTIYAMSVPRTRRRTWRGRVSPRPLGWSTTTCGRPSSTPGSGTLPRLPSASSSGWWEGGTESTGSTVTRPPTSNRAIRQSAGGLAAGNRSFPTT